MNVGRFTPRHHIPAPAVGTIGTVGGVQPGFRARVGRLIFVAALYFKIVGDGDVPGDEELERVNRHFRIACRARALLFPAVLSNVLWRKVDVKSLVAQYRANELSLQQVTAAILACTPAFLRFSDRMEMSQDIKAVCEFAPAVK